jgi:hypothetical protein
VNQLYPLFEYHGGFAIIEFGGGDVVGHGGYGDFMSY